jgi:hypothetical protein
MVVNSHNIEFGYELLSAVPRAYELYLSGELKETISGKGSEPLYYFSPKHTINPEPRSWLNTDKARMSGLPYTFIHRWERPKLQFPPYKEVYANSLYKWDKPTLVIANRYNIEWSKKPINFFDCNILDWLFENLKPDYEIVYIAVDLPEELQDNAHSIELDDISVCRNHGVKVFQEIKGECWNTSLMQVFSNCSHYITMNGGYSILASMFGGTNIAYSFRDPIAHAKELTFNEFFRYYPNHSNQRVIGVETYEELKAKVKAIYIDNLPTANVIVRTSKRPNAFARCYESIMAQDYPNINIVITTDGPDGVIYTRGAKARMVQMPKITQPIKPQGDEYGKFFPSNAYLDIVQRLIDGYVIFLDDDDMFAANNAVSIIMDNAEPDALLIWKVDFGDRILPNGSFGKEVILYDVTCIGMSYHSSHANKTDWTPWKRADYRTAKKLSEVLKVKWIDAVLTRLQGKAGMGLQLDINPKNKYMKTVKIIDPAAGKVGTLKRLPTQIADKVIAMGQAVHIRDVVEQLNGVQPKQVIEKPAPVENKQLEIAIEVKETEKPKRGRKTTKK